MEQDVRLATEIIGNDNDKSKAYYTQTLPQSTQQQEYMPSLPMFWTDHQLGLLENCREFCKRVRQQQADLETILAQSTIIQSNDASNPGPLQQQERYAVQVALTHVLSRAFTLDNGEPILVPILDLCNHTRGQYFPTTTTTTNSNSTTTTPTAQSRKNVSYRIVNDDNNNHHKTMVVSTVQDVAAQQELFITYGALGNGPLLLKYGFCLTVDTTNGWSSNVEPDGSSNDVLELRLDPASDVVLELRTGPKAYTFGPLTKAVGQFQQQQVSRNTSDGANGVNDDLDDMEAFLNDAEEEEGQEFMDDLYKDSPGEEGDDNDDEDDEDVRNEIKALRQLEKSLWDVHGTHTNKAMSTTTVTTEASLDSSDATAPTAMMERYCATLIQSERRTLAFYALAAHTVASKLEGSNQGNESPWRNMTGRKHGTSPTETCCSLK